MFQSKKPCTSEMNSMYKYTANQMILPDDFFLPFGGKLKKNNRWVKLAWIIPWGEFEEEYACNFKSKIKGEEAYNVRIALGTLIVKEMLAISDREVIEQIAENPYIQYFLGFSGAIEEAPFVSSQITHFRKRFGADILNRVNEAIAKHEKNDDEPKGGSGKESDNQDNKIKTTNHGKLILDATCTPADIQYPTDTRLLNDAREKLEEIIDILHRPQKGKNRKPRTYRNKARQSFLRFIKQRKPKPAQIRKMKGKLLRYLKRDLRIIEILNESNGLDLLNKKQYKALLVINELYRQQLSMYEARDRRIEDRIVSISQPHVRPIVRGKASADVEFGAKLTISVIEGYVHLEKLEWDAYNEGGILIDAAEKYRKQYGAYPEAILADKIFRTRDNRKFCNENGIRLSGPRLGRPKAEDIQDDKKQERIDSGERNQVEGKFGQGKRRFSLGKIMTRLKETSESTILLNLIVMNLVKRLKLLWLNFLKSILWIFYPDIWRVKPLMDAH